MNPSRARPRAAEPVARPRLGQNVLGVGRVALDLSPQSPDEDPQVIQLVPIFGAPDALEENCMRHELPRIARKLFQETILGGRQPDLVPLNRHEAAAEIDAQPVIFQHERGGVRLACPPQQGAETGQQLITTERLGQIIISTDIERPNLILIGVPTAQNQDRDHGLLTNPLANTEPVQSTHHKIQDDQIRGPLLNELNRLLTTAGSTRLVRFAENPTHERNKRRVIIHHEDPCLIHDTPRRVIPIPPWTRLGKEIRGKTDATSSGWAYTLSNHGPTPGRSGDRSLSPRHHRPAIRWLATSRDAKNPQPATPRVRTGCAWPLHLPENGRRPPRGLEHALPLCALDLRAKLLALADKALMPLIVANNSVLRNRGPEALEE